MKKLLFFLLACLFLFHLEGVASAAVRVLWQGDGAATLQWHTPKKETLSVVYFREREGETWQVKKSRSQVIEPVDLRVHTADLTDLAPDRVYEFSLGGQQELLAFRTLPSTLSRPLRLVIAGDAYDKPALFRRMSRRIAQTAPDCVVIGGDIAYTVGLQRKEAIWRWDAFFQAWQEEMVTEEGLLIPFVAVLGNHDIERPKKEKPADTLVFEMIAFECSYRALDIGSELSLFLLDSGHWSPIDGEQERWLKSALEERADVPIKIPVYHVAAYPSFYDYTSRRSERLRAHWCPLFEEAGVQIAFENHNHAFKRTHPIKAGKVDPEGIVYLGDGSWGVAPRKVHSKEWYLAKAAQQNAFWLITVNEGQCRAEAFDLRGRSIDQLEFIYSRSGSN